MYGIARAAIRKAYYAVFVPMVVFLVKRLPDRVLLLIKANSERVKKMDYNRHDIFLNIDSEIENGVRLRSCSKEPETIEWIETFFKPGDVFFDIGANVGAYSLVAAKFCRGRLKVYAFEPGFITFPQLCKNVVTNGCQESIVPLQIALSNRTGIEVFNYHNLIPGGAIHALGEPIDYKGDTFEPVLRQPVISYRIDDLIEQFQVPVPNHIKLDVDGIEFDVLRGAEKALGNPALTSVIMELEEDTKDANEIMGYLAGKGLRFHSKHKYVFGGDTGPLSRVYNYIFVRDS